MPKNIHTWWTMKEKLEKEDRAYEEAVERKRDEELRAAQEIYWQRKKEQEEAEKKAQEQKEMTAGEESIADNKPAETSEKNEKIEEVEKTEKTEKTEKKEEVELYHCFFTNQHEHKWKNYHPIRKRLHKR